jgi:proline iminopeptidase
MALVVMAMVACARTSDGPPPFEEGYVEAGDSVRLFYQKMGDGGETIVALHGGPGLDAGYLAPDLEPLAEEYRMIFYDQRGAGRSTVITDSTRVNLAAHIADLDRVRERFGLERMVLYGHSWGSMLAARYALEHPDRVSALVLSSSAPPRAEPWMPQFGDNLRAWMDSATRANVEQLAAARDTASDPQAACRVFWAVFIRGYLAEPDSSLPLMRGDVCSAPPDAIRNQPVVGRFTMGPLGSWDWRSDFADLRIPVLVIHGEHDPIPIESAREWAAAFPDAEFVTIQHAGHFPQVERPVEYFEALNAFLAR